MRKFLPILVILFVFPFIAAAQSTSDTASGDIACVDADGQPVCGTIVESSDPNTTCIDYNGQEVCGDIAPPPASGDQYAYQRQGLFDCNKVGGDVASVGATSAIGGVYVPVADAAVELNTGILVYKECVLRQLIDREREAALAGFLRKTYQTIETGRNGNALYLKQPQQEDVEHGDSTYVYGFLNDGVTFLNLNIALQAPLKRDAAVNRYAETRKAQNASLVCPYQGDLTQWWSGEAPLTLTNFWNASAPTCDSVAALARTLDIGNSRVAAEREYRQQQLSYGRGFYPVTDNAQNPLAAQIVTPAATIQSSFQKLLDSPVSQLESANDVGQMIGALYAGAPTQAISDPQGLAGLSRSTGDQPSYIDQVASESSAGVRNAAINIALNILNPALQIEQTYYQLASSVASTLKQAMQSVRTAENQCWDLVIPKVCDDPLSSDNTCTSALSVAAAKAAQETIADAQLHPDQYIGQTIPLTAPATYELKIATSTVFSSAFIDPQIAPLAEQSDQEVEKSKQATKTIEDLIKSIANTSALDVQRIAIQQLDSLVANRKIHSQNDVHEERARLTNVQDSMQTLVQDIVNDWADGTPSGGAFDGANHTGWCNVNSDATLAQWDATWKQ